MSSQVRTKTTKNKATLFPKNSYKNGGGPPKPTPEQLAELARKQMLQITDAESYVRRLGNFYPKEDVESVRKSRVSNVTNTPIKYIDFSIAPTQAMYTYGSDLLGQPKNAQIEIYKDSKDNITTYLHELVHASTMSNRGLNKGEQDYIKSRVKKPADGSERDWYITDGTEVLARKAVVAKWAADNGIIDINNDVDENTFNLIGETLRGKKDKQSKEVLRHYNELLEATGNKPKNVIDIWNTVAQVDTNNEDLPPIAKNGGTPKILTMKKTKYKQGGKPNTLNIGGIPNAQTGGDTNPFGYYGGAGDMLTSIFGNVSGSGLFKPQTGTYNQMSSSDYLNQNKYSTPYSKKDWLGNTTVYVKDASGNEVKYKDVYKDYQGYNKQAAEDFSTNQKQFNEMLPVGIQLAGLMDLQMKEQDEVANKKMTVQDFPTTAASYAPVGFAEEGGGVGSQQEMFPALRAMQKGLPPEMSKNSKRQVGKAAEEEVQVLEQMLGYRDDSPFRNKSSINIYSDTIDMGQKGDGTGTPLLAVADNGDSKILKPYSGTHFFPGASMVTEVPIAQNGGPTTHQDSVAHQANKILKYEQLKGGPGGAPLPSYADPRYLKMLMQDILPEVDKIMPNASAMEKAEAMDFVFNAGYDKTNKKITKDPRAYAIQEYYRKYDPSKLDKDGKWSGRKGAAYSFDDEYSNTIGRLPENERRVFMNMGRDWYYKNIENPAPGVYSPNYEDTWYGRIWNTNDYNEFDPNATKLVHPNKRKPQKRVNGGPSSPIPFIPSAVRIDPFDEKLKSLIKKHEGSVTDKQGKHVAYADSLGYQTIGYGHLMRGVEAPVMSQSAVDDLFNKDYQTHKSWAQKMPGFNNFSDSQKAAIIDMTFNLGDNWWEEFPIFTKALNQGDTNKAAQELRSSLWAKQVGPRADEVINLLQNKGNFQQGGQPTPKAQQGVMASRKNINQFPFLDRAGVTPAESSARSFIIDEIKSEGYREKIINLLPKNLSKTEKEKKAASLISSRLNALNSAVNAGIDNDLDEASINAEYFGPSRLKPNIRFANNSMLNNTSINVHELDHAAKRGHKLIMPEEEDVVFQNIKNSRDVPKEDRGYHMYVASTPEIGANLMQFRKFVVDNKFAKHGEKITEDKFLEIWDALDESKDKYSQDAFYDVINTLKDTKSEDAISRFTKLYNTLTNVGGKNTTGIFNAKNGGKPKNNNNEITKLLGMNKYMNGGKVMQNYMPVGNGKTKVTGFIDLEALIPIQTEKKELIVLPDGNLVPVNAKKRHSQMSDDEVTDIVPENSYILSQFGSVDIYKSEADQIQMEVENKPYNMYGSNPTPKVKTLGDIMRKKVMKPADMARLVEQKYKIMDHDDPFTIQTNAINKHRRGDYLQAIIQLSEYDKARKGIDNSIETQLSKNNQQPPQMVASNGGKVLRSGYGVPKAQVGLIANAAASLIGTGVSAYQNWKARQRADRDFRLSSMSIEDTYKKNMQREQQKSLYGLLGIFNQDPTIDPVLQSDQFISQFPSYANASYNAAFEGNRNSLYANRPEFDGSKLSMLMGERYNAQTMQAQSQLAGQLAGQRANMFSQYLQARQNIFNANSASRTGAANAMRLNRNKSLGDASSMMMGQMENEQNMEYNRTNALVAARGQNTAAHIQLGNQMSQTINNGLASGLQAYNQYMGAQQQQQIFDQWNYQRQFPNATPQAPTAAGIPSAIYSQNNPSDCILGRNIRTGLPC
ncbi:MAG: glycoside hydrolase family protein [Anaerolineae bacterium]